MDDFDSERVPEPLSRERKWVRVGWLGEPEGAFLELSYAISMYGCDEDHEDVVPDDAARLMLARTMKEKCEILKAIGARHYSSLERYYDGRTFLRSWEWKTEGEVGQLVNYPLEREGKV